MKVWYVSYGSNMAEERLACYLEGGTPEGGSRSHPGARDPHPPRKSLAVDLPGALYFAGDSPQWGGGVAFYDHEAEGPTAARAYLVTPEQFADVAAQEMNRDPSPDEPLEQAILAGIEGGRHAFGAGRYETLVEVGVLDGVPMYTFTAPHEIADVQHTAPSAAYLAMLGRGLQQSRGWDPAQVEAYFAARASGYDPTDADDAA